MALKTILNKQTDFTGEFPEEWAKGGLWRFNESDPDEDDCLLDSSGMGRVAYINNWSGTSASLSANRLGNYFRMNIVNPSSEQNYLKVTNDGSIFASLGARIVCGGWMNPTIYSVGNTFCPIFNTRQGPGQPILYLSLYSGRPRLMLYNSSGSLILDESVTPPFSLVNNGWYFLAAVIEPEEYKACYVVGDRSTGTVWISNELTIEGELNRSCTADLIMGMHADTYYYAGGFDDWFLDTDSSLTAEDLAEYFKATLFTNGGDMSGDVDALTEPGSVTLRGSDGAYPSSGQLITKAAACALSGSGRVSVNSEYTAGVTSIEQVETATSDDLEEWSAWQAIGTSGELQSPNRQYIRFRVTLATDDPSLTPKLLEIQLHDIPKAPYEKLGFACVPNGTESRHDIIQAVELGSAERMLAFCRGIQAAAPVDSYVTPVPWAMPGYDAEVVMAAGAFVQGSSIELSADGPIRPPYAIYFQGGLTWYHAKLGILMSVQKLVEAGLAQLPAC